MSLWSFIAIESLRNIRISPTLSYSTVLWALRATHQTCMFHEIPLKYCVSLFFLFRWRGQSSIISGLSILDSLPFFFFFLVQFYSLHLAFVACNTHRRFIFYDRYIAGWSFPFSFFLFFCFFFVFPFCSRGMQSFRSFLYRTVFFRCAVVVVRYFLSNISCFITLTARSAK